MEENKTTEKKELGTQWLGFLYRFFVLQCFIIVCSILGTFSKIIEHKKSYDSTPEINGLLYFLIFMYIVRLIAKISVFTAKKDKYSPLFLSLMIDFICISLPPYYGDGVIAFLGFLHKTFACGSYHNSKYGLCLKKKIFIDLRRPSITNKKTRAATINPEKYQMRKMWAYRTV